MMAKDSVQSRQLRISFTEFTYQLVQGLISIGCTNTKGAACKWAARTNGEYRNGNRVDPENGQWRAFALTTQLIKKQTAPSFGKTEHGSVWLDPQRTSPYGFINTG